MKEGKMKQGTRIPIIVKNVAEERQHIARQRCSCGETLLIVHEQYFSAPLRRDVVMTRCRGCSKKRFFLFELKVDKPLSGEAMDKWNALMDMLAKCDFNDEGPIVAEIDELLKQG